jgi:hypothetical protein
MHSKSKLNQRACGYTEIVDHHIKFTVSSPSHSFTYCPHPIKCIASPPTPMLTLFTFILWWWLVKLSILKCMVSPTTPTHSFTYYPTLLNRVGWRVKLCIHPLLAPPSIISPSTLTPHIQFHPPPLNRVEVMSETMHSPLAHIPTHSFNAYFHPPSPCSPYLFVYYGVGGWNFAFWNAWFHSPPPPNVSLATPTLLHKMVVEGEIPSPPPQPLPQPPTYNFNLPTLNKAGVAGEIMHSPLTHTPTSTLLNA